MIIWVERKVPVVMYIISNERIVGDISLESFFSTVVGKGLRSQYESDDSHHTASPPLQSLS